MSILVNLGLILIGICVILLLFKLMSVKKMGESNAVFWFLIGLMFILAGIFPQIVKHLASFLHIMYPPAAVFLVAIVVIVLIEFKNTIQISVLTNSQNEAAMQIALLAAEKERLERQIKELQGTATEKQAEAWVEARKDGCE